MVLGSVEGKFVLTLLDLVLEMASGLAEVEHYHFKEALVLRVNQIIQNNKVHLLQLLVSHQLVQLQC